MSDLLRAATIERLAALTRAPLCGDAVFSMMNRLWPPLEMCDPLDLATPAGKGFASVVSGLGHTFTRKKRRHRKK